MEAEDIIKLSALTNSEQDSADDDVCEPGHEANVAETLSLNLEVKDEITVKTDNEDLETVVKPKFMDAKQNGEPKSSVPVGFELSESLSVVKSLNSVSMEDAETGFLADQNEGNFSDHEPDKTLISEEGTHATSSPRRKRSRVAVDDQLPSVHVVYRSLTRESKQKLEELLQQWSHWHAKNCSSSNGLDVEQFTGEETYFPALSVGLNKPSAVTFWFDNHAKKQSDMELDGADIPHYDRGYSLALTGDGNLNGEAEVNASRCFNCGSYSHALKDCPKPRDNAAVNKSRKEHKSKKGQNALSRNTVRYYQSTPKGKYDGLTPGVLHAETQRLLGLRELDPPPWLNRMREIGYPPGYLEIEDQPSGITIFGEEKNSIDGEEGEILDSNEIEPPRQMTVEFPGINAPVPENADEKLWAPPPSSLDISRDRRFSQTSENHNRGEYDNRRWSSDYRDDHAKHGSDRIRYDISSERGNRSEKRWEIDSEDDDGPPGCEPGTSPSLANHFRRHRGGTDSAFSPHYSSSSPTYGSSWPVSRQRLDDSPSDSSFSPRRDSAAMLRSPRYGRSSWSERKTW